MDEAVTFLPPDVPVGEAWRLAAAHDAPVYLVGDRDHLVGTITRRRLDELRLGEGADQPLAAVVDVDVVHAHPDHPIDEVLERLAQSEGVLPIVSRAEAHRVEGVVTTETILRRRHAVTATNTSS
jgi:CBS domain-containing protein